MKPIKTVILIGAGNVATHLGMALKTNGIEVLQVYSRTGKSAAALAQKLDCYCTTDVNKILPHADLYIFSVADGALEELLNEFAVENAFVVHTSGSLDMRILGGRNLRYGVLYPLQTFSKKVKLSFSNIPLCIEAQDEEHLMLLMKLGRKISRKVEHITSPQREALHMAAVFACNFTNHLFAIADEILEKQNLSFELLQPLLDETLHKVKTHKPAEVQTGPAVREDHAIMQKHLEKLSALPAYQKIYNFISQSIIESKGKNTKS
jgi:predicted short-subunit dehydrogenase-like oxidoreductase (DUF2520 family)